MFNVWKTVAVAVGVWAVRKWLANQEFARQPQTGMRDNRNKMPRSAAKHEPTGGSPEDMNVMPVTEMPVA